MSRKIEETPRYKKSLKRITRSGTLSKDILKDCIIKIANNIPRLDMILNTASLRRTIYFILLIDYV